MINKFKVRSGAMYSPRRLDAGARTRGTRTLCLSRSARCGLFALAGLLIAAVLSTPAVAATKYWSGYGGSDNISDGNNWWGNVAPSSGDSLFFDNTAGTHFWANINYGAGSYFDNLKSFSGAGSIRITGDQTYLYVFENNNNGSLFEATATLANRTGPDSDLYINSYGSGGVAVSNVLMQNGKALIFQGAYNTLVNGSISQSGTGNATVTKNDAGTLTLTASSSYGGATTINGGTVLIANNTALGSTNAGTTVSSGAALQLSNNITVVDEALTIAGTGISSGGALRSVSGSNAYTGLITASSALTSFGAASGTTLVISNVNSGGQEFWVVGDGTTIVAGGATNSGSGTAFVKTNVGTAILSASNAWSGAEYIREGTVVLSNNNALGTGGTTYLGAVDSGSSATATLTLGNGVINSNAIVVEALGTVPARWATRPPRARARSSARSPSTPTASRSTSSPTARCSSAAASRSTPTRAAPSASPSMAAARSS